VPTVLRIGPYRFFFYAGDRVEPRHVHVERDDAVAKFWLEPVRLDQGHGFNRIELQRVHRLVLANRKAILRAWDAYFTE
jgi:hypothetical protein